MPKIILYSDYIKPQRVGHLVNSINYIALSESAEKNVINRYNENSPSTWKQNNLIIEMIESNPELKNTFEYKNFTDQKTVGTASNFITEASHLISESTKNRINYLNYIAKREGVEKTIGYDHGLFGKLGAVNLYDYKTKMRNAKGNIYRHVISIKREDAELVGFTERDNWENMVRKEMNTVGRTMNINSNDLDWVCAFHNSDTHPHVHIMMWSKSASPNVYLKQNGLEKIKGIFGKNIYQEEYKRFYEFKQNFKQDMNYNLKGLDFTSPEFLNTSIQKNINKLNSYIPENYQGRWTYGFMNSNVKLVINEIVEDLITDQPIVKELFETYLQSEIDFLNLYESEIDKLEIKKRFINPLPNDKKPFHNIILNEYKEKFHGKKKGLAIVPRTKWDNIPSSFEDLNISDVIVQNDLTDSYLDIIERTDDHVFAINQKNAVIKKIDIVEFNDNYLYTDLKLADNTWASQKPFSTEILSIEKGDYIFSYKEKLPMKVLNVNSDQLFLYNPEFEMGLAESVNNIRNNYSISTLNYNVVIGNKFRLNNDNSNIQENDLINNIYTVTDIYFKNKKINNVTLSFQDKNGKENKIEVLPDDFSNYKLFFMNSQLDMNLFGKKVSRAFATLFNELSQINGKHNKSQGTSLKNELERGARIDERVIEQKL